MLVTQELSTYVINEGIGLKKVTLSAPPSHLLIGLVLQFAATQCCWICMHIALSFNKVVLNWYTKMILEERTNRIIFRTFW